MANEKTCPNCGGEGHTEDRINQSSNKTTIIQCSKCNGKGVIPVLTKQDEEDYGSNYWVSFVG